jgi:hypothetical protein
LARYLASTAVARSNNPRSNVSLRAREPLPAVSAISSNV